jgi:hypothetical protein
MDHGCEVVHASLDNLGQFVEVERFVGPGYFSRRNVVGVWGSGCLWSIGCARPRTMSEGRALDICDAVDGV